MSVADGCDGERGLAEWRLASAEWLALSGVLGAAEAWKAKAERVLTTEKVRGSPPRPPP